ncbi:MAG: Fic family protein [Patescibacteria group bacterium]
MIRYKLNKTDLINKFLVEIEALKIIFDSQKLLPHIEENFRRESLLKSALYSARVEGNPSRLNDLDSQEELHKLEIFNLVRAYKFIFSNRSPKKISVLLTKRLHKMVMKNISNQAGSFRTEPWAIFNQAGVAIFLAPAHFKVLGLMADLVNGIQKLKENEFVKSAVFQFLFEKIHPFPDGNGRVGRLLSSFLLNISGYGFRGLIPTEEIVDNEREKYYEVLEPSNDVTGFVEFYLESFIKQAKNVLEKINNYSGGLSKIDLLPPRRKEIINIIKDHPYCTFDLIVRRFSKVNQKTLHYDLKKVVESGFVNKVGKTRGVVYLANK